MTRGKAFMDGGGDSRESEEIYRNLFENARETFVLTDLQGHITGVNRLVEDYGFQREELIGRSLFGFVAEDHRTRAIADFKVLLSGKPVAGEMEVITPKGVFCVEYRDNPILRGGQVVGVQALLTDVTKRKRAEQRLREEKDKAQKYLDIAGVMLVVIDSEQRVGLLNKKGCEILGYTEQEILGKNWFDNFLPPRTREHIRAVFAGLMAGRIHPNEHVENFVLTRTGQERLIAWHNTVLTDETGRIIGTLGSGEDITERKRAEEVLREINERLSMTLEVAGAGVWEWNLKRDEVCFDARFHALLGYAPGELPNTAQEWKAYHHPEDLSAMMSKVEAYLQGDDPVYESEHRLRTKAGTWNWVFTRGRVVNLAPTGSPERFVGIAIDVTERKRAEEALRRANRALQTIGRCNQILFHAEHEGELLDTICQLLVSEGGYFMAWVGFAEQDAEKTVRPAAQAGHTDGYLETVRITWSDTAHGQGPTGKAIRTGKPHLIRDIRTDSSYAPWREEATKRGYGSSIALPLTAGGQALGVLNLYALRSDAFDSDEIGLLSELADDLAYGITSLRTRVQRNRAEEALRESERRLDLFFSQSLDGFFFMMLDEPVRWDDTVDKDQVMEYVFSHQRLTKANQAMMDQYGATPEQLIGLTPRDFWKHDLPGGKRVWREFFDKGQLHTQTREQRLDGTPIWIDGDYICFHDAQGRITGHFGVQRDITERKRAEEAYRSLVDHSLQGLVIFQEGKAVFANQAMTEMAGYTIDEILALSAEQIRDFVHPEDRASVWQNHRRRLAGEPVPEHYEMRGLRKDGRVRWLDIHASRIDYRGKPAIQTAYIDITERKQAEESLRLSEERHRGLFENAVLGMYQTTPDGEILMANPALVRMLGYETFEELAARNLEEEGFELEHPRARFKEQMETEGRIVGLESAWKRRDGSTLWVRESARTVRDETGKTLFYEGTVEDSTERKHAEQLTRTLAAAAMELVELPAEADLFQFIAEKVLTLIGAGIVSVNSIEEDTLTVRQIAGATTVAMKLAQRLLGKAVMGMPLLGLHEVARTLLLTGKLTEIEGGFYELFFHTVPRPVCWTLEKVVGLQKCHSIGLRRPNRLLGSVTILSQKATKLNAGILEAFVNQASIALERRQAVETLVQTEERFRTLYESVQAGVLLLHADGTILHANRMACDILGMTWESLEFKTPMNLDWQMILEDGTPVPGQDYPSMTTLRTGEPIRGALRGFFSGDPARPRWQVINTEPVRHDKEGAVEQVMVTFHDITALKQAEHETRESHRFLQTVMNSFPGNVAIIDEEANIVMTNDSWAAFGQANSLAPHFLEKGVNYLQVCRAARGDGSDGAQDAAQALDAILEERRNYFEMEYPCHSPDRKRWFHLQAQGFAFENKRWVVLAHLDITERKKMEESLRESEARFATIFRASPVPIAISRLSDHHFIDVNDRWQEITGCSRAEALGHTPVELNLWVDPEQREHVIEVLLEKGTVREEVQIRRKSGEINDMLMSAELIELAGERYLLTLAQDITERKKVEQRLLDYQNRLRELAMELTLAEERERRRIAVGVHDRIGQRLAMAKLTLQSLQTSTLETNTARALEEVCQDVDKVLEDAHALTFELSNPILYEVGFEPAVESWLFQQVRDRQGIECTFEAQECRAGLDKETRVVLFDIVRELLTNVIKHAQARHVNVGIRCLAGTVHVSVGDDGIGFQPPRTGTHVSESGGFGLFNIREKLDYLGGSITMESAPGEGTRVVVVVPLTYPRNLGKKERNHEDLDRR